MKRAWVLTSWDDYSVAEQDIASDLYHTAEDIEDEGNSYRVTIEIERLA